MKKNTRYLLRCIPAGLLSLALGGIIGDEILNRIDRRTYRSQCIEMYVQIMGTEALPLIEARCYQSYP